MKAKFRLPQMGMGMQEAAILEWRKQVGDPIAEGEILLVIEAAKAEVEVPAPIAGVLSAILVEIDEVVPVRAALCVIDTDA